MTRLLLELRRDRRMRLTAVAATVVFALVVAVPAVLIPNPFFQRMVPLQGWEPVMWATAAPLVGVAFALSRRPACDATGRTTLGGVATLLAVACPTCNALVVAAVGASGALTYFAPAQPVLGLAGVALLLGILRHQTRRLEPLPDDAEPERAAR